MAQPASYDIKLVAGDDYQITVRLLEDDTPIDTSGYTFKAQVRNGYLPNADLIAEFSVNPVTGGAELSLTDEQTKDLSLRQSYYYDVQSTSPDVRTWLSGRVIVTPEVTE